MVYLIKDECLSTGDAIWFGADGGYSFTSTLAESECGVDDPERAAVHEPRPSERAYEGEAHVMIVQRTSVFPASRDVVFGKLQRLETLQAIAKPWATFEPVGDVGGVWTVGDVSSYRFRLFGVIPFGVHTIRIVRFDVDGISSREGNAHVPVWNHDITLEKVVLPAGQSYPSPKNRDGTARIEDSRRATVPLDDSHTRYTDRVEIRAGWKTPFVWLWAMGFYAHRQRKWIRKYRTIRRHIWRCLFRHLLLADFSIYRQ